MKQSVFILLLVFIGLKTRANGLTEAFKKSKRTEITK